MNELIDCLKSKKLLFDVKETSASAAIIELDVWAKPGSRIDKTFISPEGKLIVSTRSKPVEGEANAAIVTAVADLFGVSKSSVSLVRGDKSRQKRLRLLIQLSVSKDRNYFLRKIQNI